MQKYEAKKKKGGQWLVVPGKWVFFFFQRSMNAPSCDQSSESLAFVSVTFVGRSPIFFVTLLVLKCTYLWGFFTLLLLCVLFCWWAPWTRFLWQPFCKSRFSCVVVRLFGKIGARTNPNRLLVPSLFISFDVNTKTNKERRERKRKKERKREIFTGKQWFVDTSVNH